LRPELIGMSGLVYIAVLAALCAGAPTAHAETDFASKDELSQWMTYFYLKPDRERVPAAVQYYANSDLFQKKNTRAPMATFIACQFKRDPEVMERTFKQVAAEGSANAKTFLMNALWFTNTERSRQLLDKAGTGWSLEETTQAIYQQIKGVAPYDPLHDEISNGRGLDQLWAIFMATGDAAPVKRIIDVLPRLVESHDEDIIIGGAARWSLTSNARQHKRVYDICREELQRRNGTVKRLLEEVLRDAGSPASGSK